MLRQLDNNIWVAEQPLKYFGLNVGTRMTVIKLDNGESVAISPIDTDRQDISQINEIGKIKHIIAPNSYHYLFAAKFKQIYPNATFWAAPGLAEKKPELPIDKTIAKDGNTFIDGIEYLFVDGFQTVVGLNRVASINECVFFHSQTRTLILTDLAFHFDETFPLVTQLAMRIIGGYKNLSPSLLEKIAIKDKYKVREAIEKILEWDFDRVIMAHGSVIKSGGKQQLAKGYADF